MRDSLFLLADLRIDGVSGDHKIRVRNVSAGGLMADGGPAVQRGAVVWVQLRNIGWVEGTVAWVQDNRCGIAFRDEIDPKLARAPVGQGESTPRYVRPPLATIEPSQLRKI
ncbi:PilZ domain-containing protein [Novosphingobium sp. APW14]|nr:PilZ domain-containing protein [Novosphingobium sp. APW14]MDT9013705.1 PilZ domain-containing protein [Novosphingobium sp. APW14]